MNIAQDKGENALRSGQEPHQREEMDQAESASRASFTLEPEKGLTPDPEEYNKGAAQGNIKQTDQTDETDEGDVAPIGEPDFDSDVDADIDTELNADENTVTPDDLQALNGEDEDDNTRI